ncbi:MAG: PAS domain S-box protein [Deltaproteobacteria bacterium]|nr:PAS domain S-box protein [Deltaproteobacteria bacterium]
MKDRSLRVLIIEDSEDEALFLIHELKKGGYNPVYDRVETAAAMEKSLKEKQWDIILCDYPLPAFNAASAIAVLKKANMDIPVIVVSEAIGEEKAVDCMRSGASDYILKRNIAGLCPAIARELAEAEIRNKQKRAREAMREKEEQYRKITKCIPDLIWTMDFSGQFTYANEAVERTHGWTVDEFLKLNTRDVVSPQQFAKNAALIEKELMKAADPQYDRNAIFSYESEEIRKDGSTFLAEINAMSLWSEDGNPVGIIGITRDISERKTTEKVLREKDERLRGITKHLPGIIFQLYAKDNGEYGISYASESMKEMFGITANTENLLPLFISQIHEEDRDRFMTSITTAVETNNSWNFEGRIFVVTSGNMIWFQGMASPTRHEDQIVFDGILLNITERKKAEMKLQQTLDSLKRATGTTIQVLVSALDAKDPYTAGHQSRVARLACAIAREMGLSEENIEGISMAGTIHDIGKLSIPAEILTKPTKLSGIEFSLVQEHSRSGYEMLKEVESPWSLAEIVYQHHERINGSGYPRKLKGNEILLEARILAVADVVEAIASHRPYRPSLGLEAAIHEIEKNRGILYDEAVTEACLKLFRAKGYELK